MKKLALTLLLLPCLVIAQQKISLKSCVEKIGDTCITQSGERFLLPHPKKVAIPTSRNILKANLSSLVFNNYHISYERHIYNKASAMISYRVMPKSVVPFEKSVTDLIANKDVNVTRFQMGGYAITPEVRFYSHKNMIGFYIAPYARFTSLDVTLPIKYSTTQNGASIQKDADFIGKINSVSGGVLLGTQHQIFKRLVLDIWIIGGHFGSSTGNLVANITPSLSTKEQQALQSSIDNLDATPFTLKGQVTSANTAYLNAEGGWVGFRGAGFTLGFRF